MHAFHGSRIPTTALLCCALSLSWSACNCGRTGSDDAGAAVDAASPSDSGSTGDAQTGLDTSTGVDTSSGVDASVGQDAGGVGLTVYDIQDPNSGNRPPVGTEVTLAGVVVTGVDLRPSSTGFWVQEPGGGPYSGIFVYAYADNDQLPLESLLRGDVVTVTGNYEEYYDLSELTFNSGSVTGHVEPPAPTVPTGIESDPEPWEGVLVRFDGPCTVTTVRPDFGLVETSCFLLDDDVYQYDLVAGQELTQVVGLVHFGYDEFKIYPRAPSDLDGSAPPESNGNCGDLTFQGSCVGDLVRYCDWGTVREYSCPGHFGADAACGLHDCETGGCTGYSCVAKPNTSCQTLPCDLSQGCRGGLCTSSEACDTSYVSSCSGETLTFCHPYGNLVNEVVCNSDGNSTLPFTCGDASDGHATCLGTEGSDNCDLSRDPPAECAAGLVCSSSTGRGDCQPGGDAGVAEDGGALEDAGVAEDGGLEDGAGPPEDGGAEDAGSASEDGGVADEDAAVEDGA